MYDEMALQSTIINYFYVNKFIEAVVGKKSEKY
jgi:hypothetical protein